MFFLGARKNGAGVTEPTGTVVLKRTYDINPLTGTLTAAATPLPIFLQDQPDNLVQNSDFEMSQADFAEAPNNPTKAGHWLDAGNVSTLSPGQGVAGTRAIRVAGALSSRVAQTLAFEKSLGGRSFAFSFSAKADVTPAQIAGAQLEADGTASICVVNANLLTTLNRSLAIGVWPANVQAKELRVVLPVPTDATRTVFYDQVQVEERAFTTRWDPNTTFRYEHDLAAFKPEGDLIVLGFTGVSGTCRARVNGSVWFERTLPVEREKAAFGWESRLTGPRATEKGVFSGNPSDYPLADPLPAGFLNRFYNGYNRTAAQLDPVPYLPAGGDILIELTSGSSYHVVLGKETVAATLMVHTGTGPDKELFWTSNNIVMNRDTLVIEPEANRCFVVWRGAWPSKDYAENSYRQLVVTLS
jgi:hypothetical protein